MKRAGALLGTILLSAALLTGCSATAKQVPIMCTDLTVIIKATRMPYNGYKLAPVIATAMYKLGPGETYKGTSIELYDETLKRNLGASPAVGNPARVTLPEGHTFMFRVVVVAANGDYSPCGPTKTMTIPVATSDSTLPPTGASTPSTAGA